MKQFAINPQPDMNANQPKKRWYHHSYFRILLNGLMISLPIVILLFLLSLGFKLVFNMLSPISAVLNPKSSEPHWSINILSLLVLLGIFFVVGLFTRSKSGKDYFKSFEEVYLCKIPLYSTLRDLVQQFTGFKKVPFSQVVLVDAYNTGVLLTGFVTEEMENEMYTVFVPTAPNPSNGNIYHVPASRLKFLDVKPESAMRTVVGMGTDSSCLFVPEESCEKDKPFEVPDRENEG